MGRFWGEGVEWLGGMAGPGTLRASVRGRAAVEECLASTEFDPQQLTAADQAALEGAWSWLGAVAGKALEAGRNGEVDDELAYAAPWGFDPAQVSPPVLFLHGGQ